MMLSVALRLISFIIVMKSLTPNVEKEVDVEF